MMSVEHQFGWYLKVVRFKNFFSELYGDYMQAGEFLSPTGIANHLYTSRSFFPRANQFVGAGIRPIYQTSIKMFHLLGEFVLCLYIRLKELINKAYYGKPS